MSSALLSSRSATKKASEPEDVSIPLYIAGFVVTWAGIAAVNSVISNDHFVTVTTILAVLGFVFSIASRWIGIDKRIVHSLPVILAVYLGIRYLRHNLDLESLLPVEAEQSDMMIAVGLVWLSVVRSWILTSDGSVVFTAVTSIAMIGLVGAFNVNADLILFFVIYLIAALYMVMHQNSLMHALWLPKSKLTSQSNMMKTHLILCVAIGMSAMLISTVLVIPVKMIGSNLSLAQALKRMFAPTPGQDGSPKSAVVDFSDDPNFDIGTGSGYSDDEALVMTAYPDDGQEHYWRGRTYDKYTSHGWISTLNTPIDTIDPVIKTSGRGPVDIYTVNQYDDVQGPLIGPKAVSSRATASPLRTRFEGVAGRTTTLYAPYDPQKVGLLPGTDVELQESRDGYIGFSFLQEKFLYEVLSNHYNPTFAELRSAKMADCPIAIRQRYVEDRGQDVISPSDRMRLATTAEDIVSALPANQRSVFDRAEAIRRWVSERCTYSLKVDAVPDDQDAVSYFLYTSRRGYCDLYASSTALLCRYAGLPSRVVTGFAPGTLNSKQGYDIKAKDKHAWVEVYFPKVGWYPFDATIGTVEDKGGSTETKDMFAGLRQILLDIQNFFNLNGPIPVILFGIVVVCLGYVIKVEVFDRIRDQMELQKSLAGVARSSADATSDAERVAAFKQLTSLRERRLAATLLSMGMPPRASRTPATYAALAHDVLPSTYRGGETLPLGDFLVAIDQLTEAIEIAAYAPDAAAIAMLTADREAVWRHALEQIDIARRSHRKAALFGRGRSTSVPSSSVSP